MKVALINPYYGLPVPATMGGAVEELMTIIINEHEKKDSDCKFYYFQKELDKVDQKYKPDVKFKNTEIIFVKYNKFLTLCQRIFGKLCKFLHIKKKLPYYVPLDYHKKVFKQVKKLNPDLIIFENNLDSYVKKYIKQFGKEKLYFHCHIQDIPKYRIDKYVAGVIGVSNFITTDYEEFVGKDKKMNNYVVPNCVNEDKFLKKVSQKEKDEIREKFGFKKSDFLVLYCGRIMEKKGIDKLLEAMLKTPDNIKLMMIGSPGSIKNDKTDFVKKIIKIVDENSEKFKFTGYINNAELYKYYQTADLQIVPTMMEEAAGLVVIEGQLCGLPQIITKSGGMVEYVPNEAIQIDRFDNMVDNLAKNIIELSNDKEKLEKMKIASQENSKKYKKIDFYNNFIKTMYDIEKKCWEKKMNELITVAIPVYKVEKYLEKCINSVLNQTYKNLEIILVDDGSPDGCPKMCDEYAKKDKRVKVIHKENGGISTSRNVAIDIAKGEYITFIDSDDWVEPTYVEELYEAIKKYDCDLSMCGHVQLLEDMQVYKYEKVEEYTVVKNEDPLTIFYSTKTWWDHFTWAKLYRKSLFENVRFPIGIYNQDTYVIPYICKNIKKGVVIIPSVLYNYIRLRTGSATKEVSEKSFSLTYAKRHNAEVIDKNFCNYVIVCKELFYAYKSLYDKIYNKKELVKRMNKEFKLDWKKYSRYLPFKSRFKYFLFKNFRFVYRLFWFKPAKNNH